MSKLDKILDILASTSARTIQEWANQSLEAESHPVDGPMGARTRDMNRRNRDYRRRIGELDPP